MIEANEKPTRCLHCGVDVPYNARCPLCGRFIRNTAASERYPAAKDKRAGTKSVLKFIFIVTGVSALLIDAMLSSFCGWGAIVAGVLLCAWFVVLRPVFVSRPFGSCVMAAVSAVMLTSVAVDIVFGFLRWSITYVWPAAVAAGISCILLCSLIGRMRWSLVGTPLITFSGVSLVMFVIGLFRLYPNNILWILLTIYSAGCIFGLKFFLNKPFSEDLKRTFHL